jgi:S1-C subfamily serine protease
MRRWITALVLMLAAGCAHQNDSGEARPFSPGDTVPPEAFSGLENVQVGQAGQEPTRGGADVYSKCCNGVVIVAGQYLGRDYQRLYGVSGSGSIIDRRGFVLTNFHVIDGLTEVYVVLRDKNAKIIRLDNAYLKKHLRRAKIVATLPEHDLALLYVVGLPQDATVIEMGTADSLEVGSDVFAIGHPSEGPVEQNFRRIEEIREVQKFAGLWTLTTGTLSNLQPDREFETGQGTVKVDLLLRHTAALNPGNSGGPLLDKNGLLIGVNTFVAKSHVSQIGPGQFESDVRHGIFWSVGIPDIKDFLASAFRQIKRENRNLNLRPEAGQFLEFPSAGLLETGSRVSMRVEIKQIFPRGKVDPALLFMADSPLLMVRQDESGWNFYELREEKWVAVKTGAKFDPNGTTVDLVRENDVVVVRVGEVELLRRSVGAGVPMARFAVAGCEVKLQ